MTKSRIHFILLGLWLFAIAAPCVIALIDVDKPVVISNLNEEEQHEQGNKSIAEKEVVQYGLSDFSQISKWGNRTNYAFYLANILDTALEIILPPPEHS